MQMGPWPSSAIGRRHAVQNRDSVGSNPTGATKFITTRRTGQPAVQHRSWVVSRWPSSPTGRGTAFKPQEFRVRISGGPPCGRAISDNYDLLESATVERELGASRVVRQGEHTWLGVGFRIGHLDRPLLRSGGRRGSSGHRCMTWEADAVSTTAGATRTDLAGRAGL